MSLSLIVNGDTLPIALGKVNKAIDDIILKDGNIHYLIDFGIAADGVTDDSTKIQAAFDAASSGDIIMFPPGESILISNTVYFEKKLTIIGNYCNIILDSNVSAFYMHGKDECVFTQFIFTGSGKNVSNLDKQVGLEFNYGSRHIISNIRCNEVSGVGIMGVNNASESTTLQQQGSSLSNIILYKNETGIALLNRSEYNCMTNIVAYENDIGIWDNSGNNILSGFSFEGNFIGYKMSTGGNVGHGSISNGAFNHHTTYGLEINAAATGVIITAVNFYQAYNLISNGSIAVRFVNCGFDGLTTYAITFDGASTVANVVEDCYWATSSSDPKTKIIATNSAKFVVRNLRRKDGLNFNFGSQSSAITAAKTTNYTVLSSDFDCTLKGDATSGNITFSLLSAVGMDGCRITIMKIDSSGNTVTIDPNSTETINGSSSSVVLSTQWEVIQIESDGANWIRII